jgi:hypothetical protein
MQTFSTKSVIQESQVFGPTGSFIWYLNTQNIKIEAHENYQKRSYRNRYNILTANGPLTLTIPLAKGKNQQMPIQDVKISYEDDWTRSHLQTIKSSYGSSPYFEYYFYQIESLMNQKYQHLFEFNVASLTLILKLLKITKNISQTTTYISSYDQVYTLDLRQFDYLEMTYSSYEQVWNQKFGFQKNMSILDLLFCKGPESSIILKESLFKNIESNKSFIP